MTLKTRLDFDRWNLNFQDMAGLYLLDNVEDLMYGDWPDEQTWRATLKEIEELLTNRVEKFMLEQGIDINKECRDALIGKPE